MTNQVSIHQTKHINSTKKNCIEIEDFPNPTTSIASPLSFYLFVNCYPANTFPTSI